MYLLRFQVSIPVVLNWAHFYSPHPYPPGTLDNVWKHFCLSHLGEGATGIYWVEARDVGPHPIVCRTAPITENYPAISIYSVEVDKHALNIMCFSRVYDTFLHLWFWPGCFEDHEDKYCPAINWLDKSWGC